MVVDRTVGVKRGFRRGALLTVATLGIYGLYWSWRAHAEVFEQYELGRKGRSMGLPFCVAGIVFPPAFWLYQRRFIENVNAVRSHVGLPPGVSPGGFLRWEILGALVLVGPFVAHRRLQRSLNELWDRVEVEREAEADLGTGTRGATI